MQPREYEQSAPGKCIASSRPDEPHLFFQLCPLPPPANPPTGSRVPTEALGVFRQLPTHQRNTTDDCTHHHLSCTRAPSQIDTLFLLRSHIERSGSSLFYYTIHPSTHIHHPYYLDKLFAAIDTRGLPTDPEVRSGERPHHVIEPPPQLDSREPSILPSLPSSELAGGIRLRSESPDYLIWTSLKSTRSRETLFYWLKR